MRNRNPKTRWTQRQLFAGPLDELVPADHPVRDLWKILEGYDWAPWESRYRARKGRPGRRPISPMRLAAVIVLGWLRGVFSSRGLEKAIRDWLPMRWIMEGRTVDHSTIARFRQMFREELLDLLRYVIRKALEEGFASLLVLLLDEGEMHSNSGRGRTVMREQAERRLEELIKAIAQESGEEEPEERELLKGETKEQPARL